MGADMYFFMRDNPNYGKEKVTGQQMYENFRAMLAKSGVDSEAWEDLERYDQDAWNELANFYDIWE